MMKDFNVVSVPSFGDFVTELLNVEQGAVVRLCLGEQYDPERYGTGDRTFSVPARRVTLDLQGVSARGELVWLSRSVTIRWGNEGPATASDRDRYEGMADLRRIVEARLKALGYRVRPGRYALPADLVPLNGHFDCAEWCRDEAGRIRVKARREAADDE
jgi:hypothetical protein